MSPLLYKDNQRLTPALPLYRIHQVFLEGPTDTKWDSLQGRPPPKNRPSFLGPTSRLPGPIFRGDVLRTQWYPFKEETRSEDKEVNILSQRHHQTWTRGDLRRRYNSPFRETSTTQNLWYHRCRNRVTLKRITRFGRSSENSLRFTVTRTQWKQ